MPKRSLLTDYNAKMLRDMQAADEAGVELASDADVILRIVDSELAPLKREDIIEKFRFVRKIDRPTATAVVASVLRRLVKQGELANTAHGYYERPNNIFF